MSVTICEVGPRDGLQNLPRLFSVQERAHLIAELAAAGLRQIEAVSMVNPARVPQMADAEAVLDALPPLPAVQLSALVLNRRGAERALATGVRELRFAVVASDTFCRRNQNMGSDDSLAAFAAVAPMVGQAGQLEACRRQGVLAATRRPSSRGCDDPAITQSRRRLSR